MLGIRAIVEEQVSHEHLAGDVLPAQARRVEQFEPGRSGQVVDVQLRAGGPGEREDP